MLFISCIKIYNLKYIFKFPYAKQNSLMLLSINYFKNYSSILFIILSVFIIFGFISILFVYHKPSQKKAINDIIIKRDYYKKDYYKKDYYKKRLL